MILTANAFQQAKHWTEFKIVSVFAVQQLLLHNAAVGLDVATRYYDTIATLTLVPSYFVESEGLAVKGNPSWLQKNFPNSDCAECEQVKTLSNINISALSLKCVVAGTPPARLRS